VSKTVRFRDRGRGGKRRGLQQKKKNGGATGDGGGSFWGNGRGFLSGAGLPPQPLGLVPDVTRPELLACFGGCGGGISGT
jgi:hypothetical protein